MIPISFRKLLLTLMLTSSLTVFANYDFKSNGIFYYIISYTHKTIGVGYDATSYNRYSGDIRIPSFVTYNNEIYSVTKIGNYAFQNCRNLSSITIPSTVTEIGDYTFYSCTGLTSITIPDSVTNIGAHCFQSCSNLQSVYFSNNLISIGESAFEDCYDLTSITIPHSVTSIGNYSFADCSSMTKIHSNAITPPICGISAFERINTSSCELIVPNEAISAYQTADQWKDFPIISTGVKNTTINLHNNTQEYVRYDIYGRILNKPTKGINIIIMRDGTTKKMIIDK